MSEYLDEAKVELRRLDHIIYVSLKYTRTVDIIRNALKRLIDAFSLIIEGILEYNQEQKKIETIPPSPRAKADLVKELYQEDKKVQMYMSFYVFCRELIKAKYSKREEYRRHVTMIAELDNRTAEIDIDVLEDNFDHITKDFIEYAEHLLGIEQPEE
jgi:hypothetical protein